MGVGAICTALVGMGSNPALTAAIILVSAGVIGRTAFWLALRYRGKSAAEDGGLPPPVDALALDLAQRGVPVGHAVFRIGTLLLGALAVLADDHRD